MEAFEAPVPLGVSGRDAFGRDAQFDEVDGEGGEAAESGGCERRAVVGSYGVGESALTEGALNDGEDVGEGWAGESLASDEEAGVGVDERERVDADAVAGPRPALEVDGPAVVGGVGVGEGVAVGRGAARALAALVDETLAVEDGACRASERASRGNIGPPRCAGAASSLRRYPCIRFAVTYLFGLYLAASSPYEGRGHKGRGRRDAARRGYCGRSA